MGRVGEAVRESVWVVGEAVRERVWAVGEGLRERSSSRIETLRWAVGGG